jgi:hypothetical protein
MGTIPHLFMSKQKSLKLKDKMKDNVIDVPWHVWTVFGEEAKTIFIGDDSASLGSGDYKTLKELRTAMEWYVDHLGGKIVWDEE